MCRPNAPSASTAKLRPEMRELSLWSIALVLLSAACSDPPPPTPESKSAPPTVATDGPSISASNAKSFSASLTGSGSYKAGQQGELTASVNALGDYKLNEEYPYKFTLKDPPDGVSYPETSVRDVSKSGKTATVNIPFTADKPGNYTVSGVYALSVCTKENCVIEKVPLTANVKVE